MTQRALCCPNRCFASPHFQATVMRSVPSSHNLLVKVKTALEMKFLARRTPGHVFYTVAKETCALQSMGLKLYGISGIMNT